MKRDDKHCPECGRLFKYSTLANRRKSGHGVGMCMACRVKTGTRRSTKVWAMFASGDTTKEIAFKLGISPKTVEWHRANLYHDLGVNNIAMLTRMAIRSGLIQA